MGLRGISLRQAGLVFALLACLSPATARAVVRPLTPSNYSAEAVCGQPLPGRASCLAYGLVPETKAARSHSRPIGMVLAEAPAHGEAAEGAYGLRPADLHNVYNLPLDAPGTQTIGIVDAFNDPTIEADLRVYDEEFGEELAPASGRVVTPREVQTAPPDFRQVVGQRAERAAVNALEEAPAARQRIEFRRVERFPHEVAALQVVESVVDHIVADAPERKRRQRGQERKPSEQLVEPGVVGQAAVARIVADDEQSHDRECREHAADDLPAQGVARDDQPLAGREQGEVEGEQRDREHGRAGVVRRQLLAQPDQAWRTRRAVRARGEAWRSIELGGGRHGGRLSGR